MQTGSQFGRSIQYFGQNSLNVNLTTYYVNKTTL